MPYFRLPTSIVVGASYASDGYCGGRASLRLPTASLACQKNV